MNFNFFPYISEESHNLIESVTETNVVKVCSEYVSEYKQKNSVIFVI